MNNLSSSARQSIEPLEARIAPVADLVLHFISIDFPDTAVPGDSGSMTFTIENIGDDPATNKTCINIWLVPDPGAGKQPGDSVYNNGSFGRNTQVSEKIVDGAKDVALNLAPGKSTGPITKKFTLPDMILGQDTVPPTDIYFSADSYHPFNMTPGPHYIVAEVDGGNENEPFFQYHQNDYAAPPQPFDYEYQFGSFGSRSGVDLHTSSGAFDKTTLTFNGPSADFFSSGSGMGRINVVNSTTGGGAHPTFDNLAFTGTSASSSAGVGVFKGKTGGDHIALHDISADAALGKLLMPGVDIDGNMTFNGALGTLQLGKIGGSGKTLTIGGSAGSDPATKVTLGRVNDLDLTAPAGLAMLQVTDWQKGGASDSITTPFKGFALGGANIGGQLSGNTFHSTGATNKIGDIYAVSANQWSMNAEGDAGNVGTVQDITGATALGITAKSFANFKVGGTLGNHITATGDNGEMVGIKSVTAKSIDGIKISAATAGILSIETGAWNNGGQLTAEWVKSIKAKSGDFTPVLSITGPSFSGTTPNVPKGIGGGIGTATIFGALKSTWNVKWNINNLTAGSADASWKLAGADQSAGNLATIVNDLEIKGAVPASMTAAGFGKVSFGGDFTGSLMAVGDVNAALNGKIESFKAAKVIGGVFSATGEVTKFTAQQWTGGSIMAYDFNDVTFTGGKDVQGDFASAMLKVTGPTAAQGIHNLTVKGNLDAVTLDVSNGIVTGISADRWIGGSLNALSLLSLKVNGDKARKEEGNLSGVNINLSDGAAKLMKVDVANYIDNTKIETFGKIGTITALGFTKSSIKTGFGKSLDKLTVEGKTAGQIFFAGTDVNAGTIGAILLRNVGESNGGTPFGVTADLIAKYLRTKDGAVQKSLSDKSDPDSTLDTAGDYRLVIV